MASVGNSGSLKMQNDNKTAAIADLIISFAEQQPIKRVLVVGCGSGIEAAILAEKLSANVIGIDIENNFNEAATRLVDLRQGDATCLPFKDNEFDCIYSYHALEHIPDHKLALKEMNRVLSKNGYFCIGTPNRLRLLGYIGSKDATLKQKIMWNLNDIKARITGRFRNEYGAHAGFSSFELSTEISTALGHPIDITIPYYAAIYKRYSNLISRLGAVGVGKFIWPSIYFFGTKD